MGICYAIREGYYDVVEFLIKHGANVNKNDKKKQTPVSFALKNGKEKIAKLLIDKGGMKPETKMKNNKEHNKKNRKKIVEEDHQTKSEIINNIQAPKKYILVKIRENGDKTPLTERNTQNL